MHQVVEREDTPSVRGMIHKVRHWWKWWNREMAKKVSRAATEQDDQQPPQAGQQIGFAPADSGESLESAPARGLAAPQGARRPRHSSKLGKTSGSGDKDKNPVGATRAAADLKAARCRASPHAQARLSQSVQRGVLGAEPGGTKRFPAGETVTPELLRAHGFVRAAATHKGSRDAS